MYIRGGGISDGRFWEFGLSHLKELTRDQLEPLLIKKFFFINLAQNGILGRKMPFFDHFQEMYFYNIKKCNVKLVFVWSGFTRPRQGHSMPKNIFFNVPEVQKVPRKCQNSAKKCHFWTKLTSKYI